MFNTVNQEKRSCEEEPTKLSFFSPDLFSSSPGYFYRDYVAEALSINDG